MSNKYEIHSLSHLGDTSAEKNFLFKNNKNNKIFAILLFLGRDSLKRLNKKYLKLIDYKLQLDIRQGEYKWIIVNDLEYLPTILHLKEISKNNFKICLDLHEIYFHSKINMNIIKIKQKKLFSIIKNENIDLRTTVSEDIARIYSDYYKIKKPSVILNAAEFTETDFRKNNSTSVKLVYHGLGVKRREIGKLIKVMKFVDNRFELYLHLTNIDKYTKKLQQKITTNSKVHIKKPISRENLIKEISKYDLEIILYSGKSLNMKYSFPNKLFEAIQAHLGIIVGNSTTLADFVQQNKLGLKIQSNKPKKIAKEINRLDYSEVIKYKSYSNLAASKFTAEIEMEKLAKLLS